MARDLIISGPIPRQLDEVGLPDPNPRLGDRSEGRGCRPQGRFRVFVRGNKPNSTTCGASMEANARKEEFASSGRVPCTSDLHCAPSSSECDPLVHD